MRCFFYLFICLLLVGCDGPKPVIKLGVVLPLSGDFQTSGLHSGDVARLAVNESNKAGGAFVGTELFNHEGINVIRNPGMIIPRDQRQAGLTQ